MVQPHLDGRESPCQRAVLDLFRQDGGRVLYRFLDRADRVIEDTRRNIRGPERMAIIEDFDREAYRIDEVLTELLGPPSEDELVPDGSARKAKGRPAPVAVAPVEQIGSAHVRTPVTNAHHVFRPLLEKKTQA